MINRLYIYRAPEVVLKKPSVPTFSAEIWALAVHFHRVSTGGRIIFPAANLRLSENELPKNIVLQLGQLPENLWPYGTNAYSTLTKRAGAWTSLPKVFDVFGTETSSYATTSVSFLNGWSRPWSF